MVPMGLEPTVDRLKAGCITDYATVPHFQSKMGSIGFEPITPDYEPGMWPLHHDPITQCISSVPLCNSLPHAFIQYIFILCIV